MLPTAPFIEQITHFNQSETAIPFTADWALCDQCDNEFVFQKAGVDVDAHPDCSGPGGDEDRPGIAVAQVTVVCAM